MSSSNPYKVSRNVAIGLFYAGKASLLILNLADAVTTDQITMWKNKFEALAKLYSQLRQEHLELLNKFKAMQLKMAAAQEAQEKLDRMQSDMRVCQPQKFVESRRQSDIFLISCKFGFLLLLHRRKTWS